MRRAFKYKAVPANQASELKVLDWLGLCQRLYNAALEQRIDAYERCLYGNRSYPHKKGLGEYDQGLELKFLKKEFPEYALIGSQVLKDVLRRLDRAYKAFFRRARAGAGKSSGFPKFQPYRKYDSFTFPNSSGWRIEGRVFKILENKKCVAQFKLYPNTSVPGTIATVTVKKTPTGKWFVIFSCKDVPEHPLEPIGKTVGIDVGITHFTTDSDGRKTENPRYFEQDEKRLRVLQRKFDRARGGKHWLDKQAQHINALQKKVDAASGVPGRKKWVEKTTKQLITLRRNLERNRVEGQNGAIPSKRRELIRLQIARLHEKIANRRQDFVCKLAHRYATEYDRIAVEKLDIKEMASAKGDYPQLPKKIHDAAWRQFHFRIESQCEDHGREFQQPPAAKTTMTCNKCGAEKEMPLHIRIYECSVCGNVTDRTLNNALNIKAKAFGSDGTDPQGIVPIYQDSPGLNDKTSLPTRKTSKISCG
jgi:putative transposase